jgi:NADH:ubiquinone oxidoreductase subunit D
METCQDTPPYFVGPFGNPRERYLTTIDMVLGDRITNEGIRPGGAAKYYTHLWSRDLINGIEVFAEVEATYIKHPDDWGEHDAC